MTREVAATTAPERLRQTLRLLLPAPLRHAARAGSDLLDPLRIARYRASSGDRRPLPPVALRARCGRPALGFFIESGERSADELEAALDAVGRRLAQFQRVLDFGCGCARVLRALERRREPGQILHGCDVDEPAIRWGQHNHPGLRLAVNAESPPLPYEPEAFDLVYSSSVLTHIDDQAQLLWLAELRRILRPGGVAVVSVYGEYAFEGYRSGQLRGITRDIRERLGTHESLHAAGAVFAPYRRTALNTFNFVGGDEAYGISFNSPGQVRREWTSALDVVEILPRSWWSTGQDLVILEKPRDTPPPKGSSDWRPRQVASA